MNPELLRNIWLELSPQRLVLTPVVLFGIFFLVLLTNNYNMESLSGTAAALMVLFGLLWGSRSAAESVTDELRDRTWDFQRLSPIGAWTMSWGKLLGSTIYQWYGVSLCLVMYVLSIQKSLDMMLIWQSVLIWIGSCLLAQATSMLVSLESIQKTRSPGKGEAIGAFIIGVPPGIAFLVAGLPEPTVLRYVKWYGLQFSQISFVTGSLLVFLAWALVGVYRLMRVELQYRAAPWVWLSFVLFIMVYGCGVTPSKLNMASREPWIASLGIGDGDLLRAKLIWCFYLSLALSYAMVIRESKNIVLYRRLFSQVIARKYREMSTSLPKWLVTLVLSVLLCVIIVLNGELHLLQALDARMSTSVVIIASLLFAIRDFALILWVNFSGSRRADSASLVYLGILYALLPLIIGAINLESLMSFFFPIPTKGYLEGIAPPLVEASIMSWLLYKRWQSLALAKD